MRIKVVLIAVGILLSKNVFSVPTSDKLVEEIGIQGASPDEIVLTNLSGWGGTGCEGARRVVLGASVNNRQEMLSLVLASKIAGLPVRFYGNCDSGNGDRFNATYIIIK